MRPADIAADMKEMDRRKRVEMIMNSQVNCPVSDICLGKHFVYINGCYKISGDPT